MPTRNLRRIDLYCSEYKTVATIRIDEKHESGHPHLAVHYENGGDDGKPNFAAAIPPEWGDEDLIELIFLSWPKRAGRYWPTWELCARDYGSGTLFRYWKGEKAE
jgi:hypothetical protein